jgi:hypothetical protein
MFESFQSAADAKFEAQQAELNDFKAKTLIKEAEMNAKFAAQQAEIEFLKVGSVNHQAGFGSYFQNTTLVQGKLIDQLTQV